MAHERTKIEDYAFLSDTQTAALVSRDGCVDWLCLPRFDSPACFASLLGDTRNGHWRFFPEEEVVETRRGYRGDSLILETEIETKSGAVRQAAKYGVDKAQPIERGGTRGAVLRANAFALQRQIDHASPPPGLHSRPSSQQLMLRGGQ